MTYKEREKELKKQYDKFIKTDKGREWQEHWKTTMGSDSCGDFGDYLYDFYPEMLQ